MNSVVSESRVMRAAHQRLASLGHPTAKVMLVFRHPTLVSTALLLLIFSGPPKLRVRDPSASLRGVIDWVVVLHAFVWGLAGLWVFAHITKRLRARRPALRLRLPQILGLVMILCLAASVGVSSAPELTAFKAYEMLISLLFVGIFAEEFGAAASLRIMFWASTLLCIAVAVCAIWDPGLVWSHSDFDLGQTRLRGDLIASAGVVSAIAIILLCTGVRKLWRILVFALLAFYSGLLLLSLMRTAYLVIVLFFALVLLKRPHVKPLRQLAYLLCLLTLVLFLGNRLPNLDRYRDPATISTLSERTGLWRYLAHITLTRSPWLGLGYYSASRTFGPQFNPGFGTAHSMFMEVLLGAGVPAFLLLVAICLILSFYAVRLLWLKADRLSFAVCSLFMAALFFGFIGEEVDSGPTAIAFWFAAATLPCLYEQTLKTAKAIKPPVTRSDNQCQDLMRIVAT